MPLISVTSDESKATKCVNFPRHAAARRMGNKATFDASPDEYSFWERVSRQRREYMKKMHFESGECLLCIIDKSIEGRL